jgi:hypothetical protein
MLTGSQHHCDRHHHVDYGKDGAVKSLYVGRGKDIHHYSPKGNHLLAQAITERLKIDF